MRTFGRTRVLSKPAGTCSKSFVETSRFRGVHDSPYELSDGCNSVKLRRKDCRKTYNVKSDSLLILVILVPLSGEFSHPKSVWTVLRVETGNG